MSSHGVGWGGDQCNFVLAFIYASRFSFVVSVVGCSLSSSFFVSSSFVAHHPFSLDQYVDGLTRDCSDPLVSSVHTLVHVVEVFFFGRKLTPFLLVLSRRLLRSCSSSMSDVPLRGRSRSRASSRSRSRSSRRAFVTPPRRRQILVDVCVCFAQPVICQKDLHSEPDRGQLVTFKNMQLEVSRKKAFFLRQNACKNTAFTNDFDMRTCKAGYGFPSVRMFIKVIQFISIRMLVHVLYIFPHLPGEGC